MEVHAIKERDEGKEDRKRKREGIQEEKGREGREDSERKGEVKEKGERRRGKAG